MTTITETLKPRDAALIAGWFAYEAEHNHGPTIADAMIWSGDKSTSSTKYRIEKMIRAGLLERCTACPADAARTVRLTTLGRAQGSADALAIA